MSRYCEIELTPIRGLSRAQFGKYLGSQEQADRDISAGWIKGTKYGKQIIYDIYDADSCFERHKAGEWPE